MASWIEKYWPLVVLGVGAGVGVAIYTSKSNAAPASPGAPSLPPGGSAGGGTIGAPNPVGAPNPTPSPGPVSAPNPTIPPAVVAPVAPTDVVTDQRLAFLAQQATKFGYGLPSPLTYAGAARIVWDAGVLNKNYALLLAIQGLIMDPRMVAAAQAALPLTRTGIASILVTGSVDDATIAAMQKFASIWDAKKQWITQQSTLDYTMWTAIMYAAYG